MEMQAPLSQHKTSAAANVHLAHLAPSISEQDTRLRRQSADERVSLPSSPTGEEELQTWNHPSVNFWRTCAAFWCFVVMGANDAAYGVSTSVYRSTVLELTRHSLTTSSRL